MHYPGWVADGKLPATQGSVEAFDSVYEFVGFLGPIEDSARDDGLKYLNNGRFLIVKTVSF